MPCCSRRFDVTGLVSPMRTMRGLPGRQGSGRGGAASAYFTDGVPLTGASGSYIRCADSAALSFSNDIEVVLKVQCTDWTAAGNQTLVGKYMTTGNQRSWRAYVSTAGAIVQSVSPAGTSTVTTVTMTPSVALVDATTTWLRVKLDLAQPGVGSVGTIETATATVSNDEPSSWTANGTGTSTSIAGVFDSTAKLEIGAFNDGTLERFTGRIYRCIVRDGLGGTVVADFDSLLAGPTGYTDAYGNAWVIS